eukprot:c9873_g1_i1.p1 GENE.c9873_g1_i1~~c9873_g1_i1.p1  ORF type:complete len:323 (+),score=37.59 c9873_g1_i1:78-1046(+)
MLRRGLQVAQRAMSTARAAHLRYSLQATREAGAGPASATSAPMGTPAAQAEETFHRKELPQPSIALSSSEGRVIFREALEEGNLAGSYFHLAEHFMTQSDPFFCGLTTLAMVLNALAVDPKRVWKGPWRWYTEELLDCCAPTDSVRAMGGVSFQEFLGYAECQNISVVGVQAGTPEFTEAYFRHSLQATATASNLLPAENGRGAGEMDTALVCSYSRASLNQTGEGHFSPVAGFNAKRDLALVLDVARFKYPPHWVPVSALFHAMSPVDVATGLPRGFCLLSARPPTFQPSAALRTPRRSTFHKPRRAADPSGHVHGPSCKH